MSEIDWQCIKELTNTKTCIGCLENIFMPLKLALIINDFIISKANLRK